MNSPQILELSGIGNGARLQRLGIDVVRDLRGVGENLQDHLQLRMAYKVNGVRTLNTLSAHWWGKLFIGHAIRVDAQRSDVDGAFATRRVREVESR